MRSYKVFIDENFPKQLAFGLNALIQPHNKKEGIQIEIFAIEEYFSKGEKDEDWIPEVGKLNGIVITQDYRIQLQKHQRELYQNNGVGILFFSPPSNSGFRYWDMVRLLVNRWEDILKILKKDKTPFAYRCTSKSGFSKLI